MMGLTQNCHLKHGGWASNSCSNPAGLEIGLIPSYSGKAAAERRQADSLINITVYVESQSSNGDAMTLLLQGTALKLHAVSTGYAVHVQSCAIWQHLWPAAVPTGDCQPQRYVNIENLI